MALNAALLLRRSAALLRRPAELRHAQNIREFYTASTSRAGTGSRRFRQHVNPLAQQYREPVQLPDWQQVLAAPELPLHLDIGCARGKYLMDVARADARRNYVGVEIRQNVIAEAIAEAARRELPNLAFVHANINFHHQVLLPSLPGAVESVSIFHPDPWMKKRHLKRRLVTPEFVTDLAELLAPGTPIFVQTDLEELFAYMVGVFEHSQRYGFDALPENPFGIPTDRERFVLEEGGDIFRVKFIVGGEAAVV
ncbi:hypothetical protein PybrP1_000715 [[Pythium] brassicae (nom. inval.)]|nr:hypothetical protein PybrP1_000715 [[Pythium] brassicae (nom. inval.)]